MGIDLTTAGLLRVARLSAPLSVKKNLIQYGENKEADEKETIGIGFHPTAMSG